MAEDDAVNRYAVERLLEQAGCEVTCARNGQEALEIVQNNKFDFIFMDIQMPKLDGIETTKAIRSGEAGIHAMDTPIAALTAFSMPGDKERFLRAGMDTYLEKPVDMASLVDVLQKFS